MNEPTPTPVQPTSQGQTEADLLINLVMEKGYRFFLDQYGQACMIDPQKPFTAVKLESDSAESILAKEYWNEYHKAVTKNTISKANYTLRGLTEMEGVKQTVYTRVAKLNNLIIYDLGDDKKVVIIHPNGWRVTDECPVLFRRFSHQQVQVHPISGGNLADFLEFINVRDEASKLLILTYLPTALLSEAERPILLLHGPEGSGKSTCFGFIRSMIDPSVLESLDMKRNIDEMAIQANEHYCFFIDNVSYLNQEMSNTLCRFVTGEAYSKRKLYTNDTTFMMSFKRLLGLNGVTSFATSPDFLDRTIIVNLRRLDDSERASHSVLKQRFTEIKPKLFGAMLSVLSEAMRLVPDLHFEKTARLDEYYRFACASAMKLGYSPRQFMTVFQNNVDLQKEESLEASPIALIIRTYVADHGDWTGPSSALYRQLVPIASRMRLEKYLPQHTAWLIRQVRKVENTLFKSGIGIEIQKINGERCITISRLTQDTTDSISAETTQQEAA